MIFQPAPRTQAEVDAARPLDIGPEKVLEMDEATWYAQVYRGDGVAQLTLRAVAMGSILGFFLAFTNLYVGLKTGWGLGVAITAATRRSAPSCPRSPRCSCCPPPPRTRRARTCRCTSS
jgi:hypothetical protein